jgi:hypothetical protein
MRRDFSRDLSAISAAFRTAKHAAFLPAFLWIKIAAKIPAF